MRELIRMDGSVDDTILTEAATDVANRIGEIIAGQNKGVVSLALALVIISIEEDAIYNGCHSTLEYLNEVVEAKLGSSSKRESIQ